MEFRNLKANEIDARVAQVGEKYIQLLLYKDARCDMNILDETVGSLNWKREHTRDNANCTVSIWDDKKQQWISKEDTGVESNTQKEKGLASDSFKRACVNWGIGRELYTSPTIFLKPTTYKAKENGKEVEKSEVEKDDKSGKWKVASKFKYFVKEITYNNDDEIESLIIIDQNKNERFNWKSQ